MHRPAEFRACRERGKRFGDEFFSVSVLENGEAHPRLGLAMAMRTCGGAVKRNRLKRLTRESFRLHQHALPSVDITIAAREAVARAQSTALRSSLARLFGRIVRKA